MTQQDRQTTKRFLQQILATSFADSDKQELETIRHLQKTTGDEITLHDRAAAGDRAAQFVLGIQYLDGVIPCANPEAKGVEWLCLAQRRGSPFARAFLLVRELADLTAQHAVLKPFVWECLGFGQDRQAETPTRGEGPRRLALPPTPR